jgi:hypothetical protein
LPVYTGNDDISGTISVELKDTKKYEHLGIKCNLVGYLGTNQLIKKFIVIKISAHNFTHCLKKCSLLVYLHKTKHINLNFLTFKKNMKLLMVLLVE